MVILPILDSPAGRVDVAIGGTPFIIQWTWNTTGQFWTLDIFTGSGEVLATGLKIVLKYDLIRALRDTRLPKGQIICVPVNDKLERLTRDSFKTGQAKLAFIPEGTV